MTKGPKLKMCLPAGNLGVTVIALDAFDTLWSINLAKLDLEVLSERGGVLLILIVTSVEQVMLKTMIPMHKF